MARGLDLRGAPALTAVPKSRLAEIRWPALPDQNTASLLAIQFQLGQSEWWPEQQLREWQFRQLDALVAHAFDQVPFYRERLSAAGYRAGTPLAFEPWGQLPVLTREEVQDAGPALNAEDLSSDHGEPFEGTTSGSTGVPIRFRQTPLGQFFWLSFMLRHRLWHGLDGMKTFCAIRDLDGLIGIEAREKAAYPHGIVFEQWADAYGQVFPTARSALLHIHTTADQQVEWLMRERAAYLMTFASNAELLARYCLEHAIRLPHLERILAFGDLLRPEARSACRAAFGIEVIDGYSAAEVGYIGIQCPEYEHFHVQSEGVLLEVLDEADRACAPGEIGRVVVTPLHNFATPLLRYALGDYAELGPPCSCGRGLPVLRRVVGRARNVLRLPSGDVIYPGDLHTSDLIEIAPVRQFQIVQKSVEALELRLVVRRPLTEGEAAAVHALLASRMDAFTWTIRYVDEIPRSAAGKYEDVLSELAS